jgi:hypothetical protein
MKMNDEWMNEWMDDGMMNEVGVGKHPLVHLVSRSITSELSFLAFLLLLGEGLVSRRPFLPFFVLSSPFPLTPPYRP